MSSNNPNAHESTSPVETNEKNKTNRPPILQKSSPNCLLSNEAVSSPFSKCPLIEIIHIHHAICNSFKAFVVDVDLLREPPASPPTSNNKTKERHQDKEQNQEKEQEEDKKQDKERQKQTKQLPYLIKQHTPQEQSDEKEQLAETTDQQLQPEGLNRRELSRILARASGRFKVIHSVFLVSATRECGC